MEIMVLGLFSLGLLLCLLLDQSILWALTAGLGLFLFYGWRKGFSWRELGSMALSGVGKVKNILLTFLLIGMLTALWRQAGTIAVIVCWAAGLIRPALFLLMAFLLNCLVSFLTGTSFGTAATMGVICATIAAALGVDPVLAGGTVLSGVFFGDRCSPVSTSALLTAELTGTDIYRNLKGMLRSGAVPLAAACGLYALAGAFTAHGGQIPDLEGVFHRAFALHWAALIPAAVILVLSLFQVEVKLAMSLSILSALPICVFLQGMDPAGLPVLLLTGYHAADPEVSALLEGGGVISMMRVAAIVCLSASYSGIFQRTGLLNQAKGSLQVLAERTAPFAAVLVSALITGLIACNQTLTILLTHQLCRELEPAPEKLAVDLADTAVVISPLVPWSIAGAVPLASIGAPAASIAWACYLYLIPLWRLAAETLRTKRFRGADRVLP